MRRRRVDAGDAARCGCTVAGGSSTSNTGTRARDTHTDSKCGDAHDVAARFAPDTDTDIDTDTKRTSDPVESAHGGADADDHCANARTDRDRYFSFHDHR